MEGYDPSVRGRLAGYNGYTKANAHITFLDVMCNSRRLNGASMFDPPAIRYNLASMPGGAEFCTEYYGCNLTGSDDIQVCISRPNHSFSIIELVAGIVSLLVACAIPMAIILAAMAEITAAAAAAVLAPAGPGWAAGVASALVGLFPQISSATESESAGWPVVPGTPGPGQTGYDASVWLQRLLAELERAMVDVEVGSVCAKNGAIWAIGISEAGIQGNWYFESITDVDGDTVYSLQSTGPNSYTRIVREGTDESPPPIAPPPITPD